MSLISPYRVAHPLALLVISILSLAACGARSGSGTRNAPGSERPSPDAAVKPDSAQLPHTERVKRACAIAASCSAADKHAQAYISASSCVDWFGQHDLPSYGYAPTSVELLEKLLTCGQQQTTCRDFHRCFGGELVSSRLCHEGATCKGNEVIDNIGPSASGLAFDCKSLGSNASCIDLPTGAARACCVFDADKPCVPRCVSDDKGFACLFGASIPIDCTRLGATCDTRVDNLCRGKGSSCSPSDKPQCSGSNATICVGNRTTTLSCGLNPFRSACEGQRYSPCAPRGKACTRDYAGSCRGSRLTLCVDGDVEDVDCVELGFELCYEATDKRAARCGWYL